MKGKAQRKMSDAPITDPIVAPTMAPVDIDVERATNAARENSRAAIFAVADANRDEFARGISKASRWREKKMARNWRRS
jgi:hypothetical protein